MSITSARQKKKRQEREEETKGKRRRDNATRMRREREKNERKATIISTRIKGQVVLTPASTLGRELRCVF